MELHHHLVVPIDLDVAWEKMQDIGLVAPCMPGVTITSVDGHDFAGSAKIKLGPINLLYKGEATFIELDETTHRAVIQAKGADSRGNGTAAAHVTATLTAADAGTKVEVATSLDITGKPAQFGRGVMVDVADRLFGQFADRLAVVLTADQEGQATRNDEDRTADLKGLPTRDDDTDSLSLFAPIAIAVGKRALPALALTTLLLWARRHRRRSR